METPFETFENAIGMKSVCVPPRTFIMGSPQNEKERDQNETLHTVTLTNAFLIKIHLVTQKEWTRVMETNPSYFRTPKGS